MVSMERELNKLFNDTNYNKENVIIREIWSIKLELQNFFWGVYFFFLSVFSWDFILPSVSSPCLENEVLKHETHSTVRPSHFLFLSISLFLSWFLSWYLSLFFQLCISLSLFLHPHFLHLAICNFSPSLFTFLHVFLCISTSSFIC